MKKMITRRNFLKAAGVSAAALGLAACGGSASTTDTTCRFVHRRFRCGIGRCFRLDLGAQGHAGLPLGRRRRC